MVSIEICSLDPSNAARKVIDTYDRREISAYQCIRRAYKIHNTSSYVTELFDKLSAALRYTVVFE